MNALTLDPAALRTQSLFSSFTDRQLTCMLSAVKHRSHAPGTWILRSGETPDGLYVLLSGRARVIHEDGHGHALIAGYIGPNEFFGELGLLDSKPSPANIQAMERCELAFVPKKTFLESIHDNATAAVFVLQKALERLSAAHEKMASLALSSVHARVARVLLDNGYESPGGWRVNPGSEEIAAIVGASREMVSRVLKTMIASGAVRREKRKLVVMDRRVLENACTRYLPPKSANSDEWQFAGSV
jgi:CRP/FNR family transcriptional regulator, cyclic AMP receptor protein